MSKNVLARLSLGILLTIAALLSSGLANADWREDLGTLRIGIVSGDDVSGTIALAEPFRLAIQEGLNIPVEIFGARDLPSLVRAHSDGRVEYAILTGTAYAAAYVICECIEPLVAAKSSDGAHSFHAIIISRKDGGPSTPKDLSNKRLLALSKNSVASVAFAMFELANSATKLTDNDTIVSFAHTPQEAVRLFASGQGDALIGWSSMIGDAATGYTRGTLKDLAAITGASANQYRVIWKSSPIAHRVHSITRKLPGEAKKVLRELLFDLFDNDPIAYDSIEPVFGGGFSAVNPAMFEPLIRFAANPNIGTAADFGTGKDEETGEASGEAGAPQNQ